MNKYIGLIALALITLTGCKPSESLTDQLVKALSYTTKQEVFSIKSPYTFIIDGQSTEVRGVDTCLDEQTQKPFECIDLSKPFTDVYLLLPNGTYRERWSLIKEKNGNYVSLRMPDGKRAMPAPEK
jgi:hypothetical protein